MQKIPATLLLAFLTSCATMEERIVEKNIKNIEECDRFKGVEGYDERNHLECKNIFIERKKIAEKIENDRDLNLIKELETDFEVKIQKEFLTNKKLTDKERVFFELFKNNSLLIIEDFIVHTKDGDSLFGDLYKNFTKKHNISNEKLFDLIIKKAADNYENEFIAYKKLDSFLGTSKSISHVQTVALIENAIDERYPEKKRDRSGKLMKLLEQELNKDASVNNKEISTNEANINKVEKILSQIEDWRMESEKKIIEKFENTIAKKYKASPSFVVGRVIQVLNNNTILASVDNGYYGLQTIAVKINKKFVDGDVFEFALIKSGRMRYKSLLGFVKTVNVYTDINFEIEKFEKQNKETIAFLDIRKTIRNSFEDMFN
jgi:hypothetical protein